VHSVVTRSVAETEALGAELAAHLAPGDFIALSGELGAGKTCFVRGVACGLAVDPGLYVTSPTYTLLNIYRGRIPLYHFDLYRLGDGEVADLGFEEYFYGDGVCLVEWAERLGADMPEERLEIAFCHAENDSRCVQFLPVGGRYEQILRELFSSPVTCQKMF
jgi:tRNA threonylcarbamoyladenosine biosynthesis protein TsaE